MSTKSALTCISCNDSVSKHDAHFVDDETFSYSRAMPSGVQIGTYCHACFDAQVASHIDAYNEKMELAKNVNLYYITQNKESRYVRRIEKPVAVKDCDDRDEVILRLAFLAVEAGKNSLVDVDLTSVKVKHGKWQTSRWSGRAIPADIDERNLSRVYLGT